MPLGHQRAQPEAAGVVLHPAGLEGGVLPVVAEDEQPRPLRVVDHVLRENVHIGHVRGAHGARWLAVVAADAPPVRAAREAARQVPGVVLLLPHGVEGDRRARRRRSAGSGSPPRDGQRRSGGRSDSGASALVLVQVLVVAAADDAVEQHDTVDRRALPPAAPRTTSRRRRRRRRAPCR